MAGQHLITGHCIPIRIGVLEMGILEMATQVMQ